MKTIHHHHKTYLAIDGTEFLSSAECEKYEKSLPRHLVFCLRQGYTSAQLNSDQVVVWNICIDNKGSYVVDVAPGFCREGGVEEVLYCNREIKETISSTLNDAVNYVVDNDRYWRKQAYLVKVKINSIADGGKS